VKHQKLARQRISKGYSQRLERRVAAARSRPAGPIRRRQGTAGRGGGGCCNGEVGKDEERRLREKRCLRRKGSGESGQLGKRR
jgi:hypothetical protein